MDIIIASGERPNCHKCKKPLKSWNPLIVNEECPECISDYISDKLMEEVNKQLKKIKPNEQL